MDWRQRKVDLPIMLTFSSTTRARSATDAGQVGAIFEFVFPHWWELLKRDSKHVDIVDVVWYICVVLDILADLRSGRSGIDSTASVASTKTRTGRRARCNLYACSYDKSSS